MDYDDTDEMEDEDEMDYYTHDRQYYGDDDYDDEWYESEYYDDSPSARPYTRLEIMQNHFRRFISWLRDIRIDPGHLTRRCEICGKRGCVVGEKLCNQHWIPF